MWPQLNLCKVPIHTPNLTPLNWRNIIHLRSFVSLLCSIRPDHRVTIHICFLSHSHILYIYIALYSRDMHNIYIYMYFYIYTYKYTQSLVILCDIKQLICPNAHLQAHFIFCQACAVKPAWGRVSKAWGELHRWCEGRVRRRWGN